MALLEYSQGLVLLPLLGEIQLSRHLLLWISLCFVSACARDLQTIQVGSIEQPVKLRAVPELLPEDWAKGDPQVSCVTHLYRCDFDQQGIVTHVEPLDLSHPQFQEYSEEAVRSWQFIPGKAGKCFIGFTYIKSSKPQTKVLVTDENLAKDMATIRSQNRKVFNGFFPKPKIPTSIAAATSPRLSQKKPSIPKAAALKGIGGIVGLSLEIDDAGNVAKSSVVFSRPKKIFDQASLTAVRTWKYPNLSDEPTMNRKNHRVIITYSVEDGSDPTCDPGLELLETPASH